MHGLIHSTRVLKNLLTPQSLESFRGLIAIPCAHKIFMGALDATLDREELELFQHILQVTMQDDSHEIHHHKYVCTNIWAATQL